MSTIDPSQFAAAVVNDVRRWFERAVIGLNLCPFAKAVHVRGQVHYAVTRADSAAEILMDLERELRNLVALDAAERDTTLLILSDSLGDFLEFNDFLDRADQLLLDLAMDGIVQIASFHPDYQFAGTAPDDIGNFTNRAPYPTLHLLREASIDRAVQAFGAAQPLLEANIRTMQKLGHAGWATLGISRSVDVTKVPPPLARGKIRR